MKINHWAWMASAALLATAMAGSAGQAAKKSGKVSTTAADIVAARQASFLLSGALFGGMKGAIDRGDDVKSQTFATRSLARWAKNLPLMFPNGSITADSKALPIIWTDWASFEAKAASYATEAGKLADFAAAGDKAGFATQWGVVRETCASCHTAYRVEDKKP